MMTKDEIINQLQARLEAQPSSGDPEDRDLKSKLEQKLRAPQEFKSPMTAYKERDEEYFAKETPVPERKGPYAAWKSGDLGEYAEAAAKAFGAGVLDFGTTLAKGFELVATGGEALGRLEEGTISGPAIRLHQSLDEQTLQNMQQFKGLGASRALGGLVGSIPLTPAARGLQAAVGGGLMRRGAVAGAIYGAGLADPQNPERLIDPASAALGAVTGGLAAPAFAKVPEYLGRAARFAKTKKESLGAKIYSRDLFDRPGAKALKDSLFGALPLIGDRAQRLKQEQSFGSAVQSMIKSISTKVADAPNDKAALQMAGRLVKKSYDRMRDQENLIWKPVNEGMKNVKIPRKHLRQVDQVINEAMDEYSGSFVPGIKNTFNKIINNETIKFNDLKQLQSRLGKSFSGMKSRIRNGDADAESLGKLKEVYGTIYETLEEATKAMNPKLLNQFHRAKGFSKSLVDTLETNGSDYIKGITDQRYAYKFMESLLKEKSPATVTNRLKTFTPMEQNVIKASAVQQAFTSAIEEGSGLFNPSKFLQVVRRLPNREIIMGDTYKSLQGLEKLMAKNQEAIKKTMKLDRGLFGVLAGSTGAVATGTYFAGPAVPAVIGSMLITNKALSYIGATSPVKNLLTKLGAERISPEMMNYLSQRILQQGAKAGLYFRQGPNEQLILDKQDKDSNGTR